MSNKSINKQIEKVNCTKALSLSQERLNILVVEDSSSVRMTIVDSLNTLDVNIFEADDGASALTILTDQNLTIDLVLTDLNMKTMDGDELCRKIRNELNLPEIPVIVLSSRIDKKTTVELFRLGATDFLYKPFTSEEIIARLNIHLERLRLNKILVKQIGQLKDLNQIKDDLLAICSHDFRSPLQIIMGYTDLMMGDDVIKGNHRRMLDSIKTSGENLLEMIDQILVLGKAEKLSETIVQKAHPIKNIIRSCVTNFYTIASNKKLSLNFTDIDENPLVNGIKSELTRIFNNLISNAIKYTPAGGTVSVRLNFDDGKTLITSITDNGIGIPEATIPQLFKKYSQASQKGTNGEQTTGLGLFITKQLIDRYQGEIEVKSVESKGSCFIVKLPTAPRSYATVGQKHIDIEKG